MSSSEETGKLEEVIVNSTSKSEQNPGTTCSNTSTNNSGNGSGISSTSEYKRAGSVLEAVPEEMGTVTIPGEMEEEEKCSANNPTCPGANFENMGTSPSGAHMGTTSTAQGTAATQFHIPESNASDVAPSECSSYHRHDQLTKTEALSGRQHVVLWLTRTSMAEVPSVPSLRNLVASSVMTKSSRRNSSDNPIKRNFSTKSFSKYDTNTKEEPPIRKCETVIALSGMSSASSTSSSKCNNQNKIKKSPLSMFKHLSRSRMSNVSSSKEPPPAPPSIMVPSVPPSVAPSIVAESTCASPYPGMQPQNRLRSGASSVICSRCTSMLSMNHSRMTSRYTSQVSLSHKQPSIINSNTHKTTNVSVNSPKTNDTANNSDSEQPPILCKICLIDCPFKEMYKIQQCKCMFCIECLIQYISFEIMAGAYEISCPDPACEKDGVFQLHEIEQLVPKDLVEKHKAFRLNTEVALDSNRTWCPKPGCNTICHICASSTTLSNTNNVSKPIKPRSVNCPKCEKEFCSMCSSGWHPDLTCQENGKKLYLQSKTGEGNNQSLGAIDPLLLFEMDDNIKRCPMCHVPIERDAGCAQMMCKRCKHVFCWFCLKSLDDDFLLRHYDSGNCKGKLGHTRASLLWHRAQVIGIFAGFVVLLLVASPLLLITAPCVFCCRCKVCAEIEEELNELNDGGGPNSPSRMSRSNSGIAIQIMKD